MTLEEARTIVAGIHSHDYFDIRFTVPDACLDGYFTADQLEAIAVVLRAGVEVEESACVLCRQGIPLKDGWHSTPPRYEMGFTVTDRMGPCTADESTG